MYASYIHHCMMDEAMFVDTAGMSTSDAKYMCGMSYEKNKMMLMEGEGELTDKQKKMPDGLKVAILKRYEKDGTLSEKGKKQLESLAGAMEMKAEPTAVFVEAIHYADAIRRFKTHPEGLVISVVEYSISPLLALTGNLNALNAVFPSYYETPTSQLPKAFADAGCFYVLRLSSAVGKPKLLDLNPVQGAILPPTVGVDLDTPADWEMLQKIYRSNDSRIT